MSNLNHVLWNGWSNLVEQGLICGAAQYAIRRRAQNQTATQIFHTWPVVQDVAWFVRVCGEWRVARAATHHPHPLVVESAVRSGLLPLSVLRLLANHHSWIVRMAVARTEYATLGILASLRYDESMAIRRHVRTRMANKNYQ